MDIVAMVATVVATTQVVKTILKMVNPNIIAVVVSAGVVAYEAIRLGVGFDLPLLLVFIQVVIGAIGSFKVVRQVLTPTK